MRATKGNEAKRRKRERRNLQHLVKSFWSRPHPYIYYLTERKIRGSFLQYSSFGCAAENDVRRRAQEKKNTRWLDFSGHTEHAILWKLGKDLGEGAFCFSLERKGQSTRREMHFFYKSHRLRHAAETSGSRPEIGLVSFVVIHFDDLLELTGV